MDSLTQLTPTIHILIANKESDSRSMFGKGIAELCLGVRERGSLNATAKSMGMAYSKAWRIIKSTEAALGVNLLIRDGARGSTLSEEGNRLVDIYVSLEQKLAQEAVKLYQELAK